MNRRHKQTQALLAEIASYDYVPEPIPKTLCSRAAGLIEVPVRKAPAKVIHLGRHKPTREEIRERHGDVVSAAIRRASEHMVNGYPRCEFCEEVPWEVCHHLDSGGGRLQRETAENLAAICTRCHRAYHAGSFDALRDALEWARRHGFRDTERIIQRRTEKATRIRSAP